MMRDLLQQPMQEWEERRKDKLNYRYPGVGGESYQDYAIESDASKTQVERFFHVKKVSPHA